MSYWKQQVTAMDFSSEEFKALLLLAKAGNVEAQGQVVLATLPIIKGLVGKGPETEDEISVLLLHVYTLILRCQQVDRWGGFAKCALANHLGNLRRGERRRRERGL